MNLDLETVSKNQDGSSGSDVDPSSNQSSSDDEDIDSLSQNEFGVTREDCEQIVRHYRGSAGTSNLDPPADLNTAELRAVLVQENIAGLKKERLQDLCRERNIPVANKDTKAVRYTQQMHIWRKTLTRTRNNTCSRTGSLSF